MVLAILVAGLNLFGLISNAVNIGSGAGLVAAFLAFINLLNILFASRKVITAFTDNFFESPALADFLTYTPMIMMVLNGLMVLLIIATLLLLTAALGVVGLFFGLVFNLGSWTAFLSFAYAYISYRDS